MLHPRRPARVTMQASDVCSLAPRASASISVPATGASTFVSLGAASRVWIKASVGAHILFAASASAASAVATSHIPLTATTDYVFDRAGAADAGFRVLTAGGAGTLWYASV